jgi:hypothetical protein
VLNDVGRGQAVVKDWGKGGRHILASIGEYDAELDQRMKLNGIGRGRAM